MARTRRQHETCQGCRLSVLPDWICRAQVNGHTRRVCLNCAAILKRLGMDVTEPGATSPEE